MIKLLITGGSGDLGHVLSLRAAAAGFDVTSTYLNHPERITAGRPFQLDLVSRDAVQAALDQIQPEVIIHTAMPPLNNTANLRQQIVSAAYHLNKLVSRGTKMIFVSSDMVFDGLKPPYKDDDPPAPRSVYGQAKAEMEMMSDHVVRTSLIYDFEPGNRQFDWLAERVNKGEPCRLYVDEFRSPIWAANLADALLEVASSPFKGVLNVAGPHSMSRLELGRGLLETAGYEAERYIEPASQVGTGRMPNLTLDVTKAQMMLKTALLSFEEAYTHWKSEQLADSTTS